MDWLLDRGSDGRRSGLLRKLVTIIDRLLKRQVVGLLLLLTRSQLLRQGAFATQIHLTRFILRQVNTHIYEMHSFALFHLVLSLLLWHLIAAYTFLLGLLGTDETGALRTDSFRFIEVFD